MMRQHYGRIHFIIFILFRQTIDEMYRKQDMRTFMKNSYAFCMAHEKEIRRHIEMSEQGGE